MSAALAAVKSVGVPDAAGEELAEFMLHELRQVGHFFGTSPESWLNLQSNPFRLPRLHPGIGSSA